MPLTSKGTEVMAAMKKQYGDERGERVFYASKNAGRISGVDSDEFGARDDALSKPFDGEMVDRDGDYRLYRGTGDDKGKWCVRGKGSFRRFGNETFAREFMKEKKEKAASRDDAVDPKVTKAKEDGAYDAKRGQKYKNPYSKERTPTLHAAYKEAYQGAETRGDSLLSEMDAITARLDAATDPAVKRALLVRMDSALDRIDATSRLPGDKKRWTISERTGPDGKKSWAVRNKYNSIVGHFDTKEEAERKVEEHESKRNDANEKEVTKAQRDRKIKDGDWEAMSDVSRHKRQDIKTHKGDRFTIYIKDWNDDHREAEFANDAAFSGKSRGDATNPEIESLVKEAKANAAAGTAAGKAKAKELMARAERMQRDLMKKRGDAVEELPKESVDYSPGKGEDRCRNCVHFESPGACEIVEGEIDPDYWCKRFEVYRGDGVSDDLRDARARLAAAVAENQTAVAKALRAKIEELEAKHAAAPPELRGDDDDSRDDADPDELRQLERSLKYYGTHGILPNWPTVTAMTGEGSFKRSGQQGGLEKVRARIAELKKGRDDANPAREGSRAAKEDDARREELRRMVGTVKDPAKLERIKKELAEYEGGRFYDDRDDRNDAVHSKLDLALARAAKIMGRHFAKGTRADVDERYRLEWTTAKGREGEIKSHDLKDLTARFNSMKRQAQFESVALFDGTKLIGEN